jgi:hypothetical protein
MSLDQKSKSYLFAQLSPLILPDALETVVEYIIASSENQSQREIVDFLEDFSGRKGAFGAIFKVKSCSTIDPEF